MADFLEAFEKMIKNEGGYKLHKVKGDRGGMTYAGIARNFHQNWEGWNKIDNKLFDSELTSLVKKFYLYEFWVKIQGNEIDNQGIAEALFDFSVNAGLKTAVKLAQLVLGVTPDGIIGSVSLGKLNEIEEDVFISKYAIAKITRYAQICNRDKTQKKFLLGWINRTIKGVA